MKLLWELIVAYSVAYQVGFWGVRAYCRVRCVWIESEIRRHERERADVDVKDREHSREIAADILEKADLRWKLKSRRPGP